LRPETLNEALQRAAAFPDAGLRLVDRRERARWFSWDDIHDRARLVAGRLRAWGLRQGERVPLVYPTGIEFFDAFFGVLLAGGVPAPLYPPVRLGRLDEYHVRTAAMIRAVSARLVLADTRVRRLLGTTMVAAADPGRRSAPKCLSLSGLPAARRGASDALAVSPGRLGLVQFSSGTTVDPKPVALSHRALQAQSAIIEGFLPDTPDLKQAGVSWLPLYHDMGLVGCVLPALNRPGVLTLLPPEGFVARPALWLRAISRWGATVSPAPNFAYALCVNRVRDEEMNGVDLSRWRLALNGSEPVAPGVLRRFQARFAPWGLRPEALTPVYGLSEAALAVTFSDLRRPFRSDRFHRESLAQGRAAPDTGGTELVSVGRPVSGFELVVRNAEREPLVEDRVGRIWVRGPSLMDGYLDRPADTARTLVDGWLDTGDLGFVHGGELFLVGRAKEVLILQGRNHPPHAVEHAVDGVPGVRPGCAAAVSFLPEEGEREVLLLLVEHRDGIAADVLANLPKACAREVLAATGLSCDQVVALEPGTLPRTSSGKIRRAEALLRFREGTLAPPERVTLLRIAGWMARSALAYAGARGAA
jgi:acyl-CoA synthetase (AMP-forming)/AMP-acid ligase II